jgi:tetratricopeptide (TPR) repeat protein
LADIYYSNNLFEEATDTLRKGYEHNADNAPLLYTLAAYLTYTGDIELAKEYFIQAFTENQEESSIFFDVYNKEEQIITQFNHFIQKIL